jgi:hypothetical protein
MRSVSAPRSPPFDPEEITSMRQINRLTGLSLVAATLTGCLFGTTSPSSAVPATTPPASAPQSTAPSAEPVPSDALGPFDCDLPVIEDATVARAQIADVRVGTHADYDRVVFEFANGLPEISLDRATPPFSKDPSGLPIDVEGTSFLRLIMRGGTKQTEDGTSSYDGPTDFDPGFPVLVDLIEGGDFEAQSTWFVGLTGEACTRVTLLTEDGAPRLVIDVEH